MKIRINKKENLYFAINLIASILIICCIPMGIVSLFSDYSHFLSYGYDVILLILYAVIMVPYSFFKKMFIIGHLKGNGVEITEEQFPDVYKFYLSMTHELGMKKAPSLFIIEKGGILNAFATRFSCKDYIAIYSDLFDMIDTDVEVVKFIIGHELGHIKRHHVIKNLLVLPAFLIPFLRMAYSRSCEYTCDNIGSDLSSGGGERALVVLAVGKKLYKSVNTNKYLETSKNGRKPYVSFVELCSEHPFLPSRIENIRENQ